MIQREQIEKMFFFQDELNSKTAWSNWKEGTTSEWRIINWPRTIRMESMEAIDSFNWKHWKDINWKTDEQNLFVEFVDIWHFIMSDILAENKNLSTEEISKEMSTYILENQDIYLNLYNKEHSIEEKIESIERLAIFGLVHRLYDEENILDTFFKALAINKIDINKLYTWYFIKNYINEFRLTNWYKEGKYIKTVNNLEDNSFAMSTFLDSSLSKEDNFKEILFDELKKAGFGLNNNI